MPCGVFRRAAVTYAPRRWHNDILNKTAARLGQPPESPACADRAVLSGAASLAPADAPAELPPGDGQTDIRKAAPPREKAAHHRHDDHVRDAAAADHRPYRPVFGKLFERPLFAGQRDLLHRAAAALGGGRPRRHVRAEPHRLPRLRHGGKSGHRHQRCAADPGSYPGRRHHDQGRDTLAVRLSAVRACEGYHHHRVLRVGLDQVQGYAALEKTRLSVRPAAVHLCRPAL